MLAPGTDGVPHFWLPSPMGYPIFGRFLDPIWCQLGAILGHFGARAGPGWAGGVTRSANNCVVRIVRPKSIFRYRKNLIVCASRNPTSPSRTSSCTKVAQDGAKLAPNWVQKSTKNGVPHRTWSGANMEANNLQTRAKMGPKHPNTNPKTSQNERQSRVPHRTVRWGTPPLAEKIDFKKGTQQKRGRNLTGSPLLSRKSGQHGPKLGSKIDQKSRKSLCKNRSFF